MTNPKSDAPTLHLQYILVRDEVPTLHTEREFHWAHQKLAPDQYKAEGTSFQKPKCTSRPTSAQNKMTQLDQTPTQPRGTGLIKASTCFRCFLSSIASGSGRGGRISALVGAITCVEKRITKKKDIASDNSNRKKKRTVFGESDLAAVEVNKPHVVWYFELGFVEEETGWDTNNVGSGSQKQLRKTYQSGKNVRL